jgi:L,D-transpeptidase ErfK/SrfK
VRIDNRHLVPAGIGRRSILVNLPQRMLFFADSANHVTGLPIAAGRATWRTPVGAFAVETKERNPTWEVPVSIREEARREGKSLPAVVPPGPDNPLGRFWLGLSIPNVGIHGTNAPLSIYRLATHGCVRLHPDDIEWLFNRVEVGWPGEIVYEPVLLAAVGNEVFVEAHPDVYRRVGGDARQQVRARAAMLGLGARIDWTLVDAEIERRSGIARLVSRLASSD